jgi:hypothetical protein
LHAQRLKSIFTLRQLFLCGIVRGRIDPCIPQPQRTRVTGTGVDCFRVLARADQQLADEVSAEARRVLKEQTLDLAFEGPVAIVRGKKPDTR